MSSSGEQSYEERQHNEFIAITGIFPNEVEDLRKKFSGSKWIPLELNITVYPEESMTADKESNSYVHLYIRCSATYPSSPPFIDIREAKGISNQNISLLKTQLISKARELEGREVIFELIHHSQSFLYDHKAPHYGSFFDEMVFNESKKLQEKAEQLKQEQLQQKLLESQKILAIEQEKARKIEALRGANRRARFADCDDVLPVTPLERARKSSMSRQRSRSTSTGKDAGCSSDNLLQECKDMVNFKLKFSGKKEITVICGRCLGHSDRGCVTYNAIDMTTGNLGVVIKWTLYFSTNHKLKGHEWETLQKEQGVYLKQLASIEQEFKTLRQLNHKHLVHYLGMNCVTKKERIVVYVLQEFVAGCTLSTIENDFHLTIPQLQHCVRDILDALKYLHDNSIVHKNLRSSSLFVDSTGVVKMTDYSLDKKLYDLLRTLTKEEEIDFYPPTIGKGGKKSDIYRLGILLLSLNASTLNTVPIIVPDDLNPTFKDFINKCLIHDEQERWSADQLLSHSFLASTSAVAVFPKEDDLKDEENNADSQNALLDCDGIRGSRLYLEFDVLKELGKGGFGRVWKVKNKLDSRMYALKRIPLNPSNVQLNRKIKREVKLLSRLNHENIVRYYNSWIEATPEAETSTQNGDVQDSETKEKTESSIRWKIGDKDFSDEDDEDDDFIVFMSEGLKNKENTTSDKNSSTEPEVVSSNDEQSVPRMRQYMYIQMQFCEKSTLRIAIDNGLHQSKSLVWRLFREIVEGLHYIHQQGVIHRDLKPVNIFLDSNDHVKIGDFGLATDVTPKPLAVDIPFVDQDPQSRSDIDDGQQTGRVGTAFYVAPELASSGKVSYSQKVDIYSLGIIFFEMCYPPPTTLMERNIIISNLRQREIVLPNETTENLDEAMISIIKWLLQHDVTKRPNSNELIASEVIPPLLMEETELNNLLHTTISNPQSRMYKHMISSLFEQEVSTEFDHTYEIDVYGLSYKYKPSRIFSNVMDVLSRIMRLHAASYLSVPTLMPKTSVIETEQWVQIMEHGGGIVMLPHNSRIPFARYIARRETDYMKRYSIEKVYRQQKVYGCHPREQYEFVFDIVTPTTSSFIPDAEIISAMSEIVSEFPSLENRSYCIRLNHVNLLKAIMLYSELEDVEQELFYLAGERKDKMLTKSMLMDERNNLNLNEKSIGRLGQFIELEEENADKLTHLLHPVLHKKGKICNLARSSLKDLENIIKLVKSFGVKLPVVICPGLTHYISLYSGMFFQCICTLKTSKRKNVYDILSAGGRYDKLIQSFKLSDTTCTRVINQFAVGVSISIESIISAEFEANESQDMSAADFLIHSEGGNLSCEKVNLMKELQDLGIRATILYDKNMTLDDAAVYCSNRGIQHMLILLECEPGIIKVRSLDKERVTNDRRVITSEIKDVLPKLCSKLTAETKAMEYVRSPAFTNTCVSIDVRYLAPDKVHNIKKREPNIRTHVGTALQSFPSRTLAVIPVDLKMQIIGTIVARCDVSASVDSIQRSFDSIIDEFAKHKKYLSLLCDEICEVRSKKPTGAVILYSLPESNFRVIL